MSNTRFGKTNRIDATACTLKNGTGGGAPALDEVAGYPMTNLEVTDRYTLWKQSSGASMQLDYDLTGAASNIAITTAALLGHRPTTASGAGITSVAVHGVPNASGYPPGAGWGAALGTISMAGPARDGGIVFGSTSIRYLRFDITCADAFTLGRAWAGVIDYDLGTMFGPGAEHALQLPVRENRALGDVPVTNWIGDKYDIITYPLPFLSDAVRAYLRTLRASKQTLLLVDYQDVFREVWMRDYRDRVRFIGPSAGLYECPELDLVQLG